MLNILDLEDAETRARERLDEITQRFIDRFTQPVTLAEVSKQLTQTLAPVDPEGAEKVRTILGGRNGKSKI